MKWDSDPAKSNCCQCEALRLSASLETVGASASARAPRADPAKARPSGLSWMFQLGFLSCLTTLHLSF